MNQPSNLPTSKAKKSALALLLVFLLAIPWASGAQSLRRPISPDQPMWLVHIDTWNYADPQKIIDLVPEDIRPYAVMNISLSTFHDADGRFQRAEYGYEIVKSWVRACAENQMWVMIQPSSGGLTHFSDTDLSVYEEFFRDYPNVIGFNYAEQFWGYDQADNPHSAAWTDRMSHFANLLELSNQYGGYLVVSWCGNRWTPNINPIAMMKRNPAFAAACSNYTENYILCEKYTQQSYQSDMESVTLGAWLSGYSGQYGIRYDNTGWTDANGDNTNFTLATGGSAHLEHVMLTGQTVIDGPEIIWQNCFRETSRVETSDSYMMRNWTTFPQFNNVSVDIFRKILDGTVRIPTRQEVIDRTKFVIINDVNSGSSDDQYSSPETLFEGLYRMDGDGNYGSNKYFFKKTGRYPTIPTVYQLDDEVANSFEFKVNRSSYSTRWSDISGKVDEFNSQFPQEYTGTIYAGRHENAWVIYNPFKTVTTATGNIPFKYNTCSSMDLGLSRYTSGVVKEYSDRLDIYLNNYDNVLNTGLKTDVIKINGSSSQPTYSYTERGNHQASNVTSSWSDGVFTLTVEHNGAVDITINCSGTASDRLTSYTTASITVPSAPPVYTGARQYEAETFDYKDISGIVTNGYSGNVRNYTGQGYLEFGTSPSASVRDYVTVPNAGIYPLGIRYLVTGSTVNTIDLYVNGAKVTTPDFTSTPSTSDWAVNTQNVNLNAGTNKIELVATSEASASIYFDHFTVGGGSTNGIWIEAECSTAGPLWNTDTDDNASNGEYVTIQPGNNSTSGAPTGTDGHISYSFGVSESGDYTVWARVIAPTASDDSFWISVDGGPWLNWNNIASSTAWTWDDISEYTLAPGPHTLTVAYREDGAKLDKLYIANTGTMPSGEGDAASNCAVGNEAPVAHAGPDQTVADSDLNNSETIILDGTSSNDPDGSITFYAWSEGGSQIATGPSPSVELALGTHHITLTVTDDQGGTDSDDVIVTVNVGATGNTSIWLEAECGTVGSLWNITPDNNASNDQYVTVRAGNNNSDTTLIDANGQLSYSFDVPEPGSYVIWTRVIAPSANDDSFWIKVDNGPWLSWNNIASSTSWTWDNIDYYTLDAGPHTLTVAYREDGALLDKINIANTGVSPSDEGPAAGNCTSNNQPPVANAGPDQTVTDQDNDGSESVALDGTGSSDPDGSITSWVWSEDNSEIATGESPSVSLSVGTHLIILTVRDNMGIIDTDSVTVTVKPAPGSTELWLEAECSEVGSLWDINADDDASNGEYVTIQEGNNSSDGAPADANGQLSWSFDVDESGSYTIWARVIAPSANDDSFWVNVDGGTWFSWNNIASSTTWTWDDFRVYTLSAGPHTLTVAYREDGALLDKIYITNTGGSPSGEGPAASNCSSGPIIVQENEVGFCGVDGTVDSNHSGFTGAGFVNTFNAAGNGVDWSVDFTSEGTKTFTFRYASTEARPANLMIGGITVASNIDMPSTGAWTTWDTVSVEASVSSGVSTIRLEATGCNGLGNIDYLEVIDGTANSCLSSAGNGLMSLAVRSKKPSIAVVISREYYSLMGEKHDTIHGRRGFFIVRSKMSDGTVQTSKIWKQ